MNRMAAPSILAFSLASPRSIGRESLLPVRRARLSVPPVRAAPYASAVAASPKTPNPISTVADQPTIKRY
jgi:hypothetical protein